MRVAGIPLGVGNNNAAAEQGTVLWLKFEGENGSTAFTDTSGKGCTISRRDATTIQGNRARFYNNDNLMVQNADSTLFNLSGYDFKISFDFEVIQLETETIIYGNGTNAPTSLHLYIASDGNLKLIKDSVVLFNFGALSLATNYNVEIERIGSTIAFKVNGVAQTLLDTFTTTNLNKGGYGGIFGSNMFGSTKQRLYMDNIVISRKTLTV